MIAMVHRLLVFTGTYARKIRLAYLFTFLKAVAANTPLMVAVKLIDMLIKGEAEIKTAIYAAAVMLVLLAVQAVCQNIADRLQAGAGYKVFAEKRLELGWRLRRLKYRICRRYAFCIHAFYAAQTALYGFDTVIGEGGRRNDKCTY